MQQIRKMHTEIARVEMEIDAAAKANIDAHFELADAPWS